MDRPILGSQVTMPYREILAVDDVAKGEVSYRSWHGSKAKLSGQAKRVAKEIAGMKVKKINRRKVGQFQG